MTDEDKELLKRLREKADWLDPEIDMIEEWEALDAADRIEALSAENERLREALRDVFEEWAGSEGFIPETAPEGYLLHLTKRMADIARAALGDTK